MGVDYSAAFGIGFIVEPTELKDLINPECSNCNIEDMDDMEIMECLSLPEGLCWSYWGNSYQGNHTYFITTSDNATSKQQMIDQWDLLEKFIKDNKLIDKSIALIGGELIW